MFEINQKIVCINDDFPVEVYERLDHTPIEGSTYTVRDIVPAMNLKGGEDCAVLLNEIRNPMNQLGVESGFGAWRFRPLEEITNKKTKKERNKITQ